MYRSDKRPRLALIYGGASREHEISLLGKDYLRGLIDPLKYHTTELFIDRSGIWYIVDEKGQTPTFPIRLGRERGVIKNEKILPIDCAIPLLHGDMGEDGRVQGLLECIGIPYIGANTTTGAICSDKDYTKRIAASLGIPTARAVRIQNKLPLPDAKKRADALGYPLFLKPTSLGSSVGVYEVRNEEELGQIYDEVTSLGTDLLLEELIEKKRELEVGFFSALGERILTHPGEPKCEGTYGYSEKYGGSIAVCDYAEIDPEIADKIQSFSTLLSEALGLRHLARIDFFLSGDRVIFNEINTFPGFTSESLYPRLMAKAGIEPRTLINMMIEDALLDRRL